MEESDRETVARLSAAIEHAYTKTGVLIWRSFLQGFVSAIGAACATALVLLAGIYLFKTLGGPALLQSYVASLSDTIVRSQEQSLLHSLPLK